ncbi:MAG TPA: PP2C family protein-serine/threonine phosphatase [Acidobacteriota bacterium]|nr:PP2C family protein-serine/threonine phosphatase [Acidobacteriota bacterium]
MRLSLPKSRMGVFALIVVLLWILQTLFFAPVIVRYVPWLGFCLDLLLVLLAVAYLWRLIKFLRTRLLWKIKRRLFLAHIFIGAIPVFLVIFIFWISALLFYYQLSYYFISNQIGIHSAQILALNLSFREGLQELMTQNPAPDPGALQDALDTDARYLLAAYPSASITLSFRDVKTDRRVVYVNQGSSVSRAKEYEAPRWLGDREFSGLVIEDTHSSDDKKRRLFLKSFVSSDFQHDIPFSLEVSVPFDRYMLDRLKAALGQDMLLAKHVTRPGIGGMFQNAEIPAENVIDSTIDSASSDLAPSPPYPIFLFPVSWDTGTEIDLSDSQVLLVELSTAKLLHNLFRSENTTGKMIFGVLQIIFAFFLIVELASIVIGILLTKSITNAVHNLDRGTEFVKRGDFSHRIVVRSDDQLGALAASFNQMTEYVQHLVKERVQKERLERELEIAKEVQERLFPNRIPKMTRMEVAGICLPARTVSGDYYDFLLLGEHELGLALGDICGKGISAALLMANLQATLRSNVMNAKRSQGQDGEKDVAGVVERVNSQIYSYTAANKFATFFYALYDDRRQTITYCNAGHNPPLYFNGGRIRRLSAGGTVVGIFADSKYEEETVQAKTGDVFVAYTDGIVESMNEYGEEFGENRLAGLIEENRHLDANSLKEVIVSQVLSWTFAEERDDDMTLVIAKIVDPREINGDTSSETLG